MSSSRADGTGRRRARSPFDDVVPWVVAALSFAVACLVWLTAGDVLPGGRWLAVHLFTLGVLTNLILGFTGHFADTLTRVPTTGGVGWTLPAFNAGAVVVMVGMTASSTIAVGVGATVATTAVLGNHWHLRQVRRRALGARFVWIVRAYERAHVAFVHGAILGALLGTGVLTGQWYASGRVAHLHVNLLGWAGMVVLATVVFFGPTMARTRIAPGADDRAARMLRIGSWGVTAGAVLLLASGLGGSWGQALRVAAGVGLAVFAWAATRVCQAVAGAVNQARPGAAREPVLALCHWFPLVAWLDVVVVTTGTWRMLDALGLALLLGVAVQAIATTLTYLAPLLVASRHGGRDRMRHRLERGARLRAATFNTGVLVVVAMALVGPAAGLGGGVATHIGWTLVVVALAEPVAVVALGRGTPDNRPMRGE